MNRSLIVVLVWLLAGCSPAGEKPDHFAFDAGEKLAELKNKKMKEASGLAASIRNPGFLWTHNDSGNDPELFLINEQLEIKLICNLESVENRDWEDIAVGPGPDSTESYVYVGDIGDNLGRYEHKYIYRFKEPVISESKATINISQFDTIVFRLPDERKDTETLMVDPLTNNLYVVTKRERPVVVYKIALTENIADTLTAEKVASFDRAEIVAGDFSSNGKEILLKNIKNVFYWKAENNEPIEELLKTKPKILPYEQEPQGEAITFAHDDSGYYTLSEKVAGERSYLQFYKRK
jgi:hypothetical protein